MVGSGFWDGVDNGVSGGDDFFENLLNIIDFPMESLEGDNLGGDWNAKFQCLGPIPTEALRGLPLVTKVDVSNGTWDTTPVHSGRTSELKQQQNFVEQTSSTHTPLDSSKGKESVAFQAPSPISVLESSSSCSAEKSKPMSSEIPIPVRTRSKRPRSSTFNPWFVMSPISFTSKNAKEAKKKKLSQLSGVVERKENSFQRPVATKKCTHCEITKTPQWREGPTGPKTLCNACGVRYRSGRLFPEYRPAASPTFVQSLHSNSHKKVIQMRKEAIPEAVTVEMDPAMSLPPEFKKVEERKKKAIPEAVMVETEPAMSPPPEFVPMSSYLFDLM